MIFSSAELLNSALNLSIEKHVLKKDLPLQT